MSLKEDINFSIWCDFIQRDFLENRFIDLVENKTIYGATSNPAIFQQSITSTDSYNQQITMLKANHPKRIYEELAITDIKRASDILMPLYNIDNNDGFISLEVDPNLCDDTMGTIEEGARLHSLIGNDNVMIKVPATPNGYLAMRELTSMGISVNATLVFSPTQALECAKAIDEGISKSTVSSVKGVISVFVSRFDRLCNTKFRALDIPTYKLGILNATECYYQIKSIQNSDIRTLFASTGVKGDEVAPTYYIDNLIFDDTINTAPLKTIDDYLDQGSTKPSNIVSKAEIQEFFELLKNKGVKIDKIYKELLDDGLKAFKNSFKELLNKISN